MSFLQNKKYVNIAVDIGAYMLKYGAEIYRIEKSVIYMCRAYGIYEVDIYAIPSTIVITAKINGEYYTRTKKISSHGINLGRLDDLNNLSRFICENKPSEKEIYLKLNSILSQTTYSDKVLSLAYGLAGCMFCLFFGGGVIDALLAFPTGVILFFLLKFIKQFTKNPIFTNIFGGFIVALVANLLANFNFFNNPDFVTIGCLMVMVPGIIITNSVRDLIVGDFLSAVYHVSEAVLIATGIGLGATTAMALSHIM